MPTPKIDPKKIFASQAPSQDVPAEFNNYERGWDESRKNNGKPTIKQFNKLQQLTDEKILWMHQNGAALPFDETMEYEEGAVVVKDGVLQQLSDGVWNSVVAASLSDTVQTFNTPGAGVDPVTGVPDGAYFNVRSSSDESYVDEYQNVGGSAVATGKRYLSSLGVEEKVKVVEKPANTIIFSSANRNLEEKLIEEKSSKDAGAKANGINDDFVAISSLLNRKILNSGNHAISASLLYGNDQVWAGRGKGFGGTAIKPLGDFSAIKSGNTALHRSRSSFSDFRIDTANLTTAAAIDIENTFLSEFSRVWIENAPVSIKLKDSDSITFYQVMCGGEPKAENVLIGDNARSIKFFGCNFEKNPGSVDGVKGIVRVNGNVGFVASASFYGCQLERTGFIVDSGVGRWYGGKIGAQSVVRFGSKSATSFIDSDFDDSTRVHDFGYSNEIKNAYTTNMNTPVFKFPPLTTEVDRATYGRGEEFLFVVSAGDKTVSGVTNGKIGLKNGSTLLSESPTFNLQALGTSIGMTQRPVYTYISCVKSDVGGVSLEYTNCSAFGVRGGVNILENGTFLSGTTGWSVNNATIEAVTGGAKITPSPTGGWSIFQNLTGLGKLLQGKRYIAMAKFSGNARLTLGNAHNGGNGARTSIDVGVENLYDDGDRLAQIAFEYNNSLPQIISLGTTESNAEVTVKWIALIEMEPENKPTVRAVFDPPSIPANGTTTTTIGFKGVRVGDGVNITFNPPHPDIEVSGHVRASDSVLVRFKNHGTGAVDLASGIITVRRV